MHVGKPIRYDPQNSPQQERERICGYLMHEITQIACSLPEHKVVPYNNIPKREYGSNKGFTAAGSTNREREAL